jgi:hypothetical protein
MLSLALLIGLWQTSCIQTQINMKQGFAVESYQFSENGNFEFKRDWYNDGLCIESRSDIEIENGTIKLGKVVEDNFNNFNLTHADYMVGEDKDLGVISVSGDFMRLSRGMKNSSIRNTMLSLFQYKKLNK